LSKKAYCIYKIKEYIVNNVVISLSAVLILITLIGCMQSNAATTDSEKSGLAQATEIQYK